ncbi:response regulator [bacterium]|nr:response regulator [bacterium]
MRDEDKTKDQLIRELNELRRQLTTTSDEPVEPVEKSEVDKLFQTDDITELTPEHLEKTNQFIYRENQEVVQYLKESRLFSHLPEPLLQQLNPLSDLVDYPKGAIILKEGEKNSKIFFLIEGSVGVYAGNEFILNLQRSGDIFGEMSSISGKTCSATVRALSPIKIFSIKARDIGKYTDIDTDTLQHTFYRLFSMILTEKLSVTTSKAQQYEITHKKMLKEIEERKQAEIELVQYRDSLQQMVEERTSDLMRTNEQLQTEVAERKRADEKRRKLEEQLRQSQKMEAIGTLAGGIAHDFNNILSTLLGFTQLALEEQPENSPAIEYLQEVQKGGERAVELVSQLLTFSRSGEQKLKPMRFSLLIGDALKMMRATLPSHIEIRQNLIRFDDFIMANAVQIHQVIINLCSNANHAMADAGGVLEVKLEPAKYQENVYPFSELDKDKDYLKLTISDNGHGMTPEIRARIFEPFFTTKGIGEGSGLGLSVVHGILQNHNGKIMVESEPREGTAFHVFLPKAKPYHARRTEPDAPAKQGKEHILIVEDEEPLAKFYQIALQNLGYQVSVRLNGEEALDLFQANPDQFDLIFTDQAMPKMTGAQLSQKILSIRPDIPIILATGYSSVISEAKAAKMGIHSFTMKPVKLANLTATIRQIFKQ